MSPSRTKTLPVCTCRAPATMLSSVDFPTPSGPMNPTMQPAGIVERDSIERDRRSVALRDALDPRDRRLARSLMARRSLAAAAAKRPPDRVCT